MSERHYNNETRNQRLLELIERDGPCCMGKGCFVHLSSLDSMDVHVHHITPLSAGGCDHLPNLVALCRTCHAKERTGTLEIRSSAITRLGLCVCVNESKLADTLADARALAGDGGRVYMNARAGKWAYETAQQIESERKQAEVLQAQKEDAQLTPVMRVNKRCEKPFNEWITRMIQEGVKADFETWCNAGATEFRCSPETVRKYLNKRTNAINGDLFAMSDGESGVSWLTFKKLAN